MYQIIGLCVVLIAAANARAPPATPWKDCGSVDATVSAVTVTGCSAPPCILKKNNNYTVSIDFTPNKDIDKVDAVVHGEIAGVAVPFPIDNPDGCKNSGLACPLKSGNKVTYKQAIFVKSAYPKMKLVVKWELKDEKGDIACIEIPVQIED